MTSRDRLAFSIEVSDDGTPLVDALASACELSRSALKDAISKGAVWLSSPLAAGADDAPAGFTRTRRTRRAKKLLARGDRISLYFDAELFAQNVSEPALLADEDCYSVWNKPAGMPCQGSRWGDHGSIARWVEANLQPTRNSFIVHRIDRMTAGIVVLAHSKKAAANLSSQFANREVDKHYRAIVHGQFQSPLPYLIENALDGKHCSTTIESVNAFTEPAFSNASRDADDVLFSRLTLSIATGRKHQIRRHLSAAGFPVVGDRLYGAKQPVDEQQDLQLTACSIAFADPRSGERRQYQLAQ